MTDHFFFLLIEKVLIRADKLGNIFGAGKKLKQTKRKDGYLTVYFKGKSILAHRLICLFFYGRIPRDKTVNHKNFVRDCNQIENLEIVSYRENNLHAVKGGRKILTQEQCDAHSIRLRGEKNPQAKFYNSEVEEIRSLHAQGELSRTDIKRIYKVNDKTVSSLLNGSTYSNGIKSINTRKPGRPPKIQFSDLQKLEMCEKHYQGSSYKELAEQYNTSKAVIRWYIRLTKMNEAVKK